MQGNENIIVGLDIGTTKMCAVVGEISGNEINIIGIGTHPSIGLRKGVVINIESTVDSIKKAVEEAELIPPGKDILFLVVIDQLAGVNHVGFQIVDGQIP